MPLEQAFKGFRELKIASGVPRLVRIGECRDEIVITCCRIKRTRGCRSKQIESTHTITLA